MTTIAKHLLSEIVAGLDGVTPGEWEVHEKNVRTVHAGRHIALLDWRTRDEQDDANAAHIAACSPDRIRAIAAYVEQLEKALEPFSTYAGGFDNVDDNPTKVFAAKSDHAGITLADLRRARAALGGSNE